MTIKRISLALLAGLSLLAVGCSSVEGPVRIHSGPARPDAEVARVAVPMDLEVRSIDGKRVKIPYEADGDYEVRLLPGSHRLRLVYKHLWEDGPSSMVVTSRPMDLQFDARAGATYRIGYPEPRSENQATVYSEHPSAWLVDSAGQRIEASEVEGGGMLRGSFVPVPPGPAGAAAGGASDTASAEQQVMNADPTERLKFWWKLASPEQQRQFLDWTQQR